MMLFRRIADGGDGRKKERKGEYYLIIKGGHSTFLNEVVTNYLGQTLDDPTELLLYTT